MMAIYMGSNGVNRESKDLTVGVDGVNRKVKEAWAGVNGVNRKVFESSIDCTVGMSMQGRGLSMYFNNSDFVINTGTNTYYERTDLALVFSKPLTITHVICNSVQFTLGSGDGYGNAYLMFCPYVPFQNTIFTQYQFPGNKTVTVSAVFSKTVTSNGLTISVKGEADMNGLHRSAKITSGNMIIYAVEYPNGIPFTYYINPQQVDKRIKFTTKLIPN